MSAGFGHTCAVTRDSRGFCWGFNGVGQLGNGTTFRRLTATPLGIQLQLAQVSAGHGFTCGVTTGSRAYCWGHNFLGQLGDGTTSNRTLPVEVGG